MPSHVDDVALASDAGTVVDHKNQHHGTGNEDGQADINQDATTSTGVCPPAAKKKRGRKKTIAQRGPTALPRNRGTGFEEYFADPPMTPDEAEEEKLEIYAPSFPFEERIQSCIQRFRGRRRLQNDQIAYFNEYLFLGGIDTSPNAYTGLDTNDLKELTPAQRREATATDTVNPGADERFYNGDDEHWFVDFAGVAAGFFSTSLSQQTGFEPKRTEALIGIVENFLRYVLHHEVCPEYTENVQSALQVCQQAREEWPALNQLGGSLPGCFNLAATELFSSATTGDWSFLSFSRPDDFDPKMTFLAICTLCNEAATLEGFIKGNVKVLREFSCTMEVVKVERPSTSILDTFSALQIDGGGYNIESVGRVFFKPAVIEDEWEKAEVSISSKDADLWVYLEDSLIANIVPRMKMDMTLIELSTGIRFVKTISRIVPSFYTFLPQQMMRPYKQPRENHRPAPSVLNPLAEEAQLGEEDS